jgi:hypothetical protein
VLRKKDDLEQDDVFIEPEEAEPTSVADGLPRLGETDNDVDDDLPWPDTGDFSGDAGEEGDESPVEETAYVKEIHPDGREEVYMTTILMKHTGVYMKGTEAHPMGPMLMLEWDADEDIWFFHSRVGEE